MLVVALSESIGTCEKHLESQTRYNHVSNVIKRTIIETDKEAAENLRIIHDEVNIENNCCTGWLEWNNTLYDKACVIAEHCRSGDTLNAFYSTEIAKKIKRLMNYLPIWTLCYLISKSILLLQHHSAFNRNSQILNVEYSRTNFHCELINLLYVI